MKKTVAAILTMAFTLLTVTADNLTSSHSSAATSLKDATSIGSPILGADLFGTFPDEKINIYGRTADRGEQPVARLTVAHSLPVKSKIERYERGLREGDATAVTDIDLTHAPFRQEAWISVPDSSVVIKYGPDMQLFCTLSLTSDYPFDIKSFDDWITLSARDSTGVPFCTMLKVIPGKGNITTNPDGSLTLNYMHGATLVITTVTASPAAGPDLTLTAKNCVDDARLRLFRASIKTPEKLYAGRNDKAPASISLTDLGAPAENPDPEEMSALLAGEEIAAGEVYIGSDTLDIAVADADALVRCRPGKLELLPKLPPQWDKGQSNELKLRGGFVLLFEWQDRKIIGGTITYAPAPWESAESITFDLLVNGEVHKLTMEAGETLPLENFIELVRPFIQ